MIRFSFNPVIHYSLFSFHSSKHFIFVFFIPQIPIQSLNQIKLKAKGSNPKHSVEFNMVQPRVDGYLSIVLTAVAIISSLSSDEMNNGDVILRSLKLRRRHCGCAKDHHVCGCCLQINLHPFHQKLHADGKAH